MLPTYLLMLPTYLLMLPTYLLMLPTNLLMLPTNLLMLPTYLLMLPTYHLSYLPPFLPITFPTYHFSYLPPFLPTTFPTYQLTYLPMYLATYLLMLCCFHNSDWLFEIFWSTSVLMIPKFCFFYKRSTIVNGDSWVVLKAIHSVSLVIKVV